MSNQVNQAEMDITQYKKMVEAMSKDMRAQKEALEKEREQMRKAQEDTERLAKEREELKKYVEAVKEEKRQGYSEVKSVEVDPFLDTLKKNVEKDPRFSQSIDHCKSYLDSGLKDAFTNEDQKALFHTIRAASSANQALSSRVEELFQSQKEWESKFEAIKKEKEETHAKKEEELKAAQEAATLKEKMAEDLRKELEELKAQYEKSTTNIKNVDSHFEKNEVQETAPAAPATGVPPPPLQEGAPQTVTATASNDPHYFNGFNTLFDFTPRQTWRGNAY